MTTQESGNTSDKDPHIDLRASCNSIPTSHPRGAICCLRLNVNLPDLLAM
jgi:hypothetical protein